VFQDGVLVNKDEDLQRTQPQRFDLRISARMAALTSLFYKLDFCCFVGACYLVYRRERSAGCGFRGPVEQFSADEISADEMIVVRRALQHQNSSLVVDSDNLDYSRNLGGSVYLCR
jgi:hypothetical protein